MVLQSVLVSSYSFCKFLNGFIIKCKTKAGIVRNFEVQYIVLCEIFTKSATYCLTYLALRLNKNEKLAIIMLVMSLWRM